MALPRSFLAKGRGPATIVCEREDGVTERTEDEISIGGLAEEIIDQINPTAKIVTDDERIRPADSEVERLLGANGKIKELTGWSPAYALKDGMAETIRWFRESPATRGYKHDIYNV